MSQNKLFVIFEEKLSIEKGIMDKLTRLQDNGNYICLLQSTPKEYCELIKDFPFDFVVYDNKEIDGYYLDTCDHLISQETDFEIKDIEWVI